MTGHCISAGGTGTCGRTERGVQERRQLWADTEEHLPGGWYPGLPQARLESQVFLENGGERVQPPRNYTGQEHEGRGPVWPRQGGQALWTLPACRIIF